MNNLKILISFLFLYVGTASMINFLWYWKGNLKVWHDPRAKIFWTKFSEISLGNFLLNTGISAVECKDIKHLFLSICPNHSINPFKHRILCMLVTTLKYLADLIVTCKCDSDFFVVVFFFSLPLPCLSWQMLGKEIKSRAPIIGLMALGLQGAPRDKNSEFKKSMIRLSKTIPLWNYLFWETFSGVHFIYQRAVVTETVAIGYCN